MLGTLIAVEREGRIASYIVVGMSRESLRVVSSIGGVYSCRVEDIDLQTPLTRWEDWDTVRSVLKQVCTLRTARDFDHTPAFAHAMLEIETLLREALAENCQRLNASEPLLGKRVLAVGPAGRVQDFVVLESRPETLKVLFKTREETALISLDNYVVIHTEPGWDLLHDRLHTLDGAVFDEVWAVVRGWKTAHQTVKEMAG